MLWLAAVFPVIQARASGMEGFSVQSSATNVCSEGWLHLLSVPTDRDTLPAGPSNT